MIIAREEQKTAENRRREELRTRKGAGENLHLAPRESLLKLFDIMDEESPHHRELIAELRAQVLEEALQA